MKTTFIFSIVALAFSALCVHAETEAEGIARKFINETLKPALLARTGTDEDTKFLKEYIQLLPHLGPFGNASGSVSGKQSIERLENPKLVLYGKLEDIVGVASYDCVGAGFLKAGTPIDGGLGLVIVIDKVTKKVLLVFRIPGG